LNLSFYTAAVGAQQQQERLNIHGNNIANVNTYGFRARVPSFQSLMTGPVQGTEEDLPRGVGARLEAAEAKSMETGLYGTDRLLDYAIEGSGFFALQDPTTGAFTYTRDGSFIRSSFEVQERDENGDPAVDEDGLPVMTTKWYLSDGRGRFVLSRTGTPVEVTDLDDSEELPIGIFDFINYNGMQHDGDNQMGPVDKNGQVRLGEGKLVQGYLEMSNTDLANELAKVIETQRSFSFILRMATTSDEIETTVNNLR